MGKNAGIFRLMLIVGLFMPTIALAISQENNSKQETDPKAVKITGDTLECDQQKNQCIAEGNARIVKEDKDITSNKLIAYFAKDQKEATTLTHIEAEGNVILTLPDTILQGDRGTYDHGTEIAKIYGNVKITRGKNQLNGKYGEVNFKTGHYKIYSKDPGAKKGTAPSQVEALIITPPKTQTHKKL